MISGNQCEEFSLKIMIFIDESGINLALTRLFARSSKGERARDSKPIKRGKNVSVIRATKDHGTGELISEAMKST
ncbi:hypothetical protein B9G53_07335 [Pseudanabaena sp. SR411]|nr:hypothetical protein B9G53_07335 [Pseudanabaena sp. SR411]